MSSYLFVSATGWVAVLALGVEMALPYLLRRTTFLRSAPDTRPYLQRMQPHFFIGYGIAGISFAHACASMSGGRVATSNASLMAGTFSMMLLFLQVLIGINLQNKTSRARAILRRIHFWTMVGCAVLLGMHIAVR